MKLNDLVSKVVSQFIQAEELFTALDVSNKVKESLPLARHREVRDVVRELFTSDIETSGYARTPITVTLSDGKTADALLYHPLSDTWDLDSKYDAQKRAQASTKTTAPTQPVTIHPPVTPPGPPPVVTTTVSATVSAASNVVHSTKDLWDQLFKTQPSLFPRH